MQRARGREKAAAGRDAKEGAGAAGQDQGAAEGARDGQDGKDQGREAAGPAGEGEGQGEEAPRGGEAEEAAGGGGAAAAAAAEEKGGGGQGDDRRPGAQVFRQEDREGESGAGRPQGKEAAEPPGESICCINQTSLPPKEASMGWGIENFSTLEAS